VNLTRIDHLTRWDHYHLSSEDECYFLREYTARQGFEVSETNDTIQNLKKPMDRRGRPEWHYKEQAIKCVATELGKALVPQWLRRATIVPVPPHLTKADPLYDDRVTQIGKLMGADVREIIVQTATFEASHGTSSRPSPAQLRSNYRVDESLCVPAPTSIGILDDVLTAGAHYRAIADLLSERFPGVQIVGIFYARRLLAAPPTP
jgi:hypothetical protein